MKRKSNKFIKLLKFYTKFRIPWLTYIASVITGLVYSELTIQASKSLIKFNLGELYNKNIIKYAILYVGASLVAATTTIIQAYASNILTIRARRSVFNHINNMKMTDIDKENPSSLISSVLNEVPQATQALSSFFLMFASLYGISRAIYILFKFNSTVATYLLLVIPVAVLMFFLVGKINFHVYKASYQSLNTMTMFFSEHLSVKKHVKSLGLEKAEIELGNEMIHKKYIADIKYALGSGGAVLLNRVYLMCTTLVTCIFGSREIKQGRLESTGLVTFDGYSNNINQYLAELLTQYQNVTGTEGALTHTNALLDYKSENLNKGTIIQIDKDSDIIFNNVSFSFNPNTPVLNDISFTIPKGKITAIIGKNGSGKSTIIKLLLGLYKINEGQINIGNTSIYDLKLSFLRNQFGYILQNNQLFMGSIKDNLLYGAKDIPYEDMIKYCKMADCYDFIENLPQGFDTLIDEDGKNLSGGQRQRIAIARTLITNPKYLLLDEATASLDHNSATNILNNIIKDKGDKTIIFISHNMDEVLEADNIIVLTNGTIESMGTHDELLKTSETYKSYLSNQMIKE